MPEITRSQYKTICDWSNKENYSVHYRHRKFLLGHATITTTVKCVISFPLRPPLESYISFNKKKTAATENTKKLTKISKKNKKTELEFYYF